MKSALLVSALLLPLCACTSTNLNRALGTPKNPTPVLTDPRPTNSAGQITGEALFIIADYNVLRTAMNGNGINVITNTSVIKPEVMRPYLEAGFNLSDTYCRIYLKRTEEAYRRRKYARSITNDTGTVITSILGLANAGKDVIAGSAALFGFGDSLWRNYDESFLITPELSNVSALVYAAQENYKQQVLGPGVKLPENYSAAQGIIKKYAGFCTYLEMQRLLKEAAEQKQRQLQIDTQQRKNAPATPPSPVTPVATPTPTPTPTHPAQQVPLI